MAAASPWLTIDECAAYLRVSSERAVRRLMREHGLPSHLMGGRYRFDVRELDAWLRAGRSGAAAEVQLSSVSACAGV